jgi:AraC-like DNA-binding protein
MTERLSLRLPEDVLPGPESDTPPHTLRPFAVAPALADRVAHLMLYRERLPAGEELLERVLPDGAVRLAVQLGPRPRAEVIGPSAAPALVRLAGRMEGFSVTLQPGAALALLGVPAGELSERVVPLEALWGRAAADLAEQVAARSGDALRAAALQRALAARRVSPGVPPSVAAAARLIGGAGGQAALREVAVAVGLGERRLQQLFQAHLGLSPRRVARLARLQALLRSLRHERRPAWADLAVARGFYDQAHLANEFRALVGMTPGEFVARRVSPSSKTA